MKLFKLTVICGSILSLAGCFSAPTNPDTTYKPAMSPAYVDLLIEKAKAEERARVMAELAEQNQDDKRFSEIKINQLESKIDTLEQPAQGVNNLPSVASTPPVTETLEQENTSSDPLLEQWKNIYAQTEEQPKTAVVVEEIAPPAEVAQVSEEVVYSAPVDKEVASEPFVASSQEYLTQIKKSLIIALQVHNHLILLLGNVLQVKRFHALILALCQKYLIQMRKQEILFACLPCVSGVAVLKLLNSYKFL